MRQGYRYRTREEQLLSSADATALSRIRDLERQIREKDHEIARLRQELAKKRNSRKGRT